MTEAATRTTGREACNNLRSQDEKLKCLRAAQLASELVRRDEKPGPTETAHYSRSYFILTPWFHLGLGTPGTGQFTGDVEGESGGAGSSEPRNNTGVKPTVGGRLDIGYRHGSFQKTTEYEREKETDPYKPKTEVTEIWSVEPYVTLGYDMTWWQFKGPNGDAEVKQGEFAAGPGLRIGAANGWFVDLALRLGRTFHYSQNAVLGGGKVPVSSNGYPYDQIFDGEGAFLIGGQFMLGYRVGPVKLAVGARYDSTRPFGDMYLPATARVPSYQCLYAKDRGGSCAGDRRMTVDPIDPFEILFTAGLPIPFGEDK